MPTENKTANLGLNSWLGTDQPQRADFVADNTIIDTVVSSHLNDSNSHLSSSDRTLLKNPFKLGYYSGNGSESRTITFDFNPSVVFVFLKNKPLAEYDSNYEYTLCNSAVVAANGVGSTLGISLSSKTLTVSQSTSSSDGRFINLNKNGSQYFYIAFK